MDDYLHGTPFGMVGTRTWENGFFAQDDFRVTRRLTLNLGLRWDVLTWPVEVDNRQANFDLTTGALVVAGSNGTLRTSIPNDYHDLGPRLGFAYQLTGDGKTVVRGGYGLFYFIDRGGIEQSVIPESPVRRPTDGHLCAGLPHHTFRRSALLAELLNCRSNFHQCHRAVADREFQRFELVRTGRT